MAFEERLRMTIDTQIGTRQTGDAVDASATETTTTICAVFEPTAANRARGAGQSPARIPARGEIAATDALETV